MTSRLDMGLRSNRSNQPRAAASTEALDMLTGIVRAAQIIPTVSRTKSGSIPLTVISGFLGAGKTTLLNHMLVDAGGRRIAVLVNDFGPVNIDADLIRARNDDTIELTNGCACCSISSDLTLSLVKLTERAEPPDVIVLEASGIADPRGIAQIALANPALRLDGIICVVDGETLIERLADPACSSAVRTQVIAADFVVLNKLDLATAEQITRAREWLGINASRAPIIETAGGAVPTDVLLGIGTEVSAWQGSDDHDIPYRSWSASGMGPLHRKLITAVLESLPKSVIRGKGILSLMESPNRITVYQRVGARSNLITADDATTRPGEYRFVFIGPPGALDEMALARELRACQSPNC